MCGTEEYWHNFYNNNNNEANKERGFDWSYGSKSHTKGIWMWNTPLVVKSNDKEARYF